VDVWKNSNELGKAGGQAALQLCQGKKASEITINVDSSVAPAAGNSPTDFKTPGGNTVKSLILKPTPLLAADLTKIFTAGWYVTKDKICAGVKSSDPGAQACGV
jgi:D-xylose transport system substrate-binding protein